MKIHIDDVIAIQKTLIQIWQCHIDDWHNGAENFMTTRDPDGQVNNPTDNPTPTDYSQPASSSMENTDLPVPKNGHVLKLLPTGGVFCQKCGKMTQLLTQTSKTKDHQ